MQRHKVIFLLWSLVSCGVPSPESNSPVENKQSTQDSVIPNDDTLTITKVGRPEDTVQTVIEFDALIKDGIARLENGDSLSIDESIFFVKIYNSIGAYELSGKSYEKFESKFGSMIPVIVDQLQCKISTGMGYYCPHYNLLIGGGFRFPPDSYIIIKDIKQ